MHNLSSQGEISIDPAIMLKDHSNLHIERTTILSDTPCILLVVYMFLNERGEGRKKERKKEASKVKQTNKTKQHSTPKAVTFQLAGPKSHIS